MPSTRGGKYGFVFRDQWKRYRALRRKGVPKKKAARISNAAHRSGARRKRSKRGKR